MCALLLALAAAPALAEETRTCTPLTPPALISVGGCYVLEGDFEAQGQSDHAIIIDGVDAEIDLAGFRLKAAPSSSAAGIQAINSGSVKISNGAIEGFLFGIRSETDRQNSLVEISNVDISGGARGVFVQADEVRVHNTNVHDVTGYVNWPQAHSIGIEVNANSCDLRDNRVSDIYPVSTAEGIALSLSNPPLDCTITGNEIENGQQPRYGRSFGLWLGGRPRSEDLKITDNRVQGVTYAMMAFPTFNQQVTDNEFVVDCMPGDVSTYGDLTDHNSFVSSGRICRDKVAHLRDLAKAGSPEWNIRLAAALLEDQELGRRPTERCESLREAAEILEGLQDTMIQAKEQMLRVEGLLPYCSK
ncbi:hypothetical protein AWJ14_09380 [Hoeflea olei]|uniref:Right handed beta helix domain-containing protein n=1 Tax=Hoeflea olei TaxID=1480615 RepID=A0A1C1Z0I3_9HYPH|nr:hypothetical protein AWJ14_09380 [Hoeflea olei]